MNSRGDATSSRDATRVTEQFVHALSRRDRDGMLALLAPTVRMRGMAPGRSWRTNDAHELVDDILLRDFFGPEVTIEEVSWLGFREIVDRNSAGYHLCLRRGDERLDCEQHTFFDIEGGLIYGSMLTCSGFTPRPGEC
ncbi:nuclear transport factor 2-like protein [Nocardioides korecus]